MKNNNRYPSIPRFIICLVASFIASPVLARVPVEIKIPPLNASQWISQELRDWNNKQTLPLQPHQLTPTGYLEKNPDVKGLIINHWLGTGKTLLAIGFAERNPSHPVIILAPGFLEGHWLRELEKYGVKDKSRYRFVSHDSPGALVKEDLSNTILIVDESHKLVQKVRLSGTDSVYAPLYFNLRKSYRILALTGTPIYNSTFDSVYQINLVAGKDELPFNEEEFRIGYSKVDAFRAYWRGHLLESIMLPWIMPPVLLASAFISGLDALAGSALSMCGTLGLALFSSWPINIPMRTFDPIKLENTIKKYISYYNFNHEAHFYPKQFLHINKLAYNSAQLNFLFEFYDSKLNANKFIQLLKDAPVMRGTKSAPQKESILLNSSAIQNLLKQERGAGREIGNLFFIKKSMLDKANQGKHTINYSEKLAKDANSPIIFPEKFKLILETIKPSKGPCVVYSHYYYNGLLLFKQFLDASGYQGKYRIFEPSMSKEQQTQIVDDFNNNRFKILLLHPEITEGISLKGTSQLHFLEVPINSALQKQIIGRAIRYQSHMHLPNDEQKVDVYMWCYVFPMLDFKAKIALRGNWHHSFSELNYYSVFGSGRIKIDPNAYLKNNSPDGNAYLYLNILDRQMESFKNYTQTFCIENSIYSEAG